MRRFRLAPHTCEGDPPSDALESLLCVEKGAVFEQIGGRGDVLTPAETKDVLIRFVERCEDEVKRILPLIERPGGGYEENVRIGRLSVVAIGRMLHDMRTDPESLFSVHAYRAMACVRQSWHYAGLKREPTKKMGDTLDRLAAEALQRRPKA